jgi:hypothetical protein
MAQLREFFQYLAVLDGDKMPGLGVFGTLRAPPGVEDGQDEHLRAKPEG